MENASKDNQSTVGDSEKKDPTRKPSGAAKRKLRKEKLLQHGGAGGPEKSGPTTHPKTTQGELPKSGGVKRNRSDGSTPDTSRQQPKRINRGVKPSASYAAAVTDVRVAVLPQNYPTTVLSEEQAGLIKTALLQALDRLTEGESAPRFSGVNLKGGFLLASCADQATKDWLERTVMERELWPGAKLSIRDAKDVPKPIRALAWIPGPKEEPKKMLRRLKVQNPGLNTDTWSLVDEKPDPKGRQLIFLMSESSWKKIEDVQCRPYFGLSRVAFKQLGRKKDGGTEDMLIDDEGPTDDGPSTSTGGGT